MPWQSLKKSLQTVGDKIEEGVKRAPTLTPPPVKEWVGAAIDQTKETLTEARDIVTETRDKVTEVSGALSQSVQEHTQHARVQLNKVGGQLHDGVSATHQGIQQVANSVNTGVADMIDQVAGEKAQPLTDFIREDGVQTITGLAFTPIYIAQRGVIGYEAYQAFDRGDITLGELVVQVLAPTARTAKTFLEDPENQETISKFVGTVIPEKIQNEYLMKLSTAGETVGGLIPQTPQDHINSLLSYRKPSPSTVEEAGVSEGEVLAENTADNTTENTTENTAD